MHYFLRNHGMNVKIHNFSIRLCVLSQTKVQCKCGTHYLSTVIALYSRWLWLGAFSRLLNLDPSLKLLGSFLRDTTESIFTQSLAKHKNGSLYKLGDLIIFFLVKFYLRLDYFQKNFDKLSKMAEQLVHFLLFYQFFQI